MKNRLKILFFAAVIVFLPNLAGASDADQIGDCYVKDLQMTIAAQNDSSLLVTEKIVADCGLPGKHGIFRVVPEETKTDKGVIEMPVSLIGITDFDNNKIPYSESKDSFNKTISWKIGDPDKTISGENRYKVSYSVKNAIRSNNAEFDELYWNLSGNFWDIKIDKFAADIIFPAGITRDNSEIFLYRGQLGENSDPADNYEWTSENVLRVTSNQALPPQGITVSVTFPKGVIKAYQPGYFEIYGAYFWFFIPVLVFIASYFAWNKYGKDPVVNKTIIPEFEIPENLTPMEMGLLAKNGSFSDPLITATIIDLAVKKYLIIEEIPKTGIFGKQDFRFKKIIGQTIAIGKPEIMLIDKIFGANQEILLSDLKKNFYQDLPKIKKTGIDTLSTKGLIYQSGLNAKMFFMFLGFVPVIILYFTGGFFRSNLFAIISLIIATIILFAFGAAMPKRTPHGAELNWRIKGFKLYMETAEIYRARFNEKENIFEKFLPYAIVFGIAKLWVKMEEIYGKEYFSNYHPVWYAGTFNANFDADAFSSQLSSISAGIAANVGTSSGAHGSGFSGGGGGGGGGGSW